MAIPSDDSREYASYERCLELLGSDINGLTETKVEARLNQYGFNKLPTRVITDDFKSWKLLL